MKFIDLFAGLGGLHKALYEPGHKCVFVSEPDPALREVYQENWGIELCGDKIKVLEKDIDIIPKYDILCAGFSCQPFSKAGYGSLKSQYVTLKRREYLINNEKRSRIITYIR